MTFKKPLFLLFFFLIVQSNSVLSTESFDFKKFDSLVAKCIKYIDNQKLDKAYPLFEIIEQIEIPANALEAKADYYLLKSHIEEKKGNYEEQYKLLKAHESLCKKLNTPERIGTMYLSYASYYEQFFDYNNAYPFFLEALKHFKKTHNILKIAYVYNKLGLISYQESEYERAIQYFLSAHLNFKKFQYKDPVNAYWMQNTLSNIGLCYRHLKQYDKSLKYFKYALLFSRTQAFEKERPIAVLKTNIGVVYGNQNKFDLAIFWLNSGIKDCLNPKNEEIAHGANSLLYLSKIYRKAGKLELAHEALNSALVHIKEGGFNYLYPGYLYNLSELQKEEGKLELAYENIKRYAQFKDSVQNQESKIEIGKQFLTHELERKIDDNNILEKENQISNLRQKIYLGISLSILIILGISYYNYRRLKLKNIELSILNKKFIAQSENLSDLNFRLEQLNRNKSYLMQSIAHDLRAPIGNIMGLNEIMESEVNNPEQIKEYFPMIHGSCMLSINIIEDILDQSMIEKGTFGIKKSRYNIQTVIKESMDVLSFKSSSKNINLVADFHQDISFDLDMERIKRVFINIIMNAIKFSPRGSSIIIHQSIINQFCVIQVEDQGIGMKEETIDKIFERHTKASKSGTENEASIGIGLSITKLIVEAHGGKIHVESKPNSGSSFYIELPIS